MAQMKIARWGNSLAVRIPADVVRELGLKEGETVGMQTFGSTRIEISRDEERAAIMKRIDELARPFPSDYKFDREEANAR